MTWKYIGLGLVKNIRKIQILFWQDHITWFDFYVFCNDHCLCQIGSLLVYFQIMQILSFHEKSLNPFSFAYAIQFYLTD